jgi:hypothetical protein
MKAASLFAVPISPEKRAWLLDVLSDALSGTETDDQFEQRLHQLTQPEYSRDADRGWWLAMHHLERYRRGLELDIPLRILAQRLLANPPPPVTRKPLTLPDLQRNRIAGLIHPALTYLLIMVVLSTLAAILIPNVFPDWSWTSNKPSSW